MKFNKTDRELFNGVEYIVEASDNEQFHLWIDFSSESDRPMKGRTVKWVQENPGFSRQIGQINKRPIVVQGFYVRINGKRVLFYEGCSQLVDHVMIREWIEHHGPTIDGQLAHCNAANFHICLAAIGAFK